MTIRRTALTPPFYTEWQSLFSPTCPSCQYRNVTTTSAINRGLRATKERTPVRKPGGTKRSGEEWDRRLAGFNAARKARAREDIDQSRRGHGGSTSAFSRGRREARDDSRGGDRPGASYSSRGGRDRGGMHQGASHDSKQRLLHAWDAEGARDAEERQYARATRPKLSDDPRDRIQYARETGGRMSNFMNTKLEHSARRAEKRIPGKAQGAVEEQIAARKWSGAFEGGSIGREAEDGQTHEETRARQVRKAPDSRPSSFRLHNQYAAPVEERDPFKNMNSKDVMMDEDVEEVVPNSSDRKRANAAESTRGLKIIKHTSSARDEDFWGPDAPPSRPFRLTPDEPALADSKPLSTNGLEQRSNAGVHMPASSNTAVTAGKGLRNYQSEVSLDRTEAATEFKAVVDRIRQLEEVDQMDNKEYRLNCQRADRIAAELTKRHRGDSLMKRIMKNIMKDTMKGGAAPKARDPTTLWRNGRREYQMVYSRKSPYWSTQKPVVVKTTSDRDVEEERKGAATSIVRMVETMMRENRMGSSTATPHESAKEESAQGEMSEARQKAESARLLNQEQLDWLKKRAEADDTELLNLKNDLSQLKEALEASEREKRAERAAAAEAAAKAAEAATRAAEEAAKSKDPDGDEDDGHPVSIPYTTASSQFMYGTNTVLAALRAGKRKLYALHTMTRSKDSATPHPDSSSREEILRLAETRNIPIHRRQPLRLLNAMSGDRPHNSFVLETSVLPCPPIISLGTPNLPHATIPLKLGPQTAEAITINGAPTALALPVPSNSNSTSTSNTTASAWPRYPLILFLDGVTDPGNLGNILRTAHFYDVTAVVIATNTCAPLSSAVVAKASAGACEALPVFAASRPSDFIYSSQKTGGWRVYAAVAPPGPNEYGFRAANKVGKHVTTETLSRDSPLGKWPSILMLGAEGEGLREIMRRRADFDVSVVGGQSGKMKVDVGVESLNVGVAAGVLLEGFMRKPDGWERRREKEKVW